MDLPRLVRRLSSYGLDENNSNPLASVAPTSSRSSISTGLTVDTSIANKAVAFRKLDSSTPTMAASPFSREPTPSSTRSSLSGSADGDEDHVLRRRRSNSECLMLAKSNGGQELPGPCKEYISSVKQILARSSDDARPGARRRSMSMRTNSAASIHEHMALH